MRVGSPPHLPVQVFEDEGAGAGELVPHCLKNFRVVQVSHQVDQACLALQHALGLQAGSRVTHTHTHKCVEKKEKTPLLRPPGISHQEAKCMCEPAQSCACHDCETARPPARSRHMHAKPMSAMVHTDCVTSAVT